MPTLSTVLTIGKSALRAQQIGLSVTGNNIANVNTEGYSRKRANLRASLTTTQGVGMGVTVQSMTRIRDRFLDGQFRFEEGLVGRLEALEVGMSSIEAIFTEVAGGGTSETGAVFNQPGGASLSGSFNRFFNALQDLANNTESQATRAQVREEATFMVDQFHRIDTQLSKLRDEMDLDFKDGVAELNLLLKGIARMNTRIITTKGDTNDVAGNLEDERDRLIDKLSNVINVAIRNEEDGTITVIGTKGEGTILVEAGAAFEFTTLRLVKSGATVNTLVQASTLAPVSVSTGRLQGIIEIRDQKIVNFQASLNELAQKVVGRINAVHATGFGLDGSTNVEFFDPSGTTARQISLSSAIVTNLDKIAAMGASSSDPTLPAGPGDGSVALALSDLRLEKSLGGGTQTIEEFYSDLIGRIGAEAQEVFNDAAAQRLVQEQVTTRRENVRGVSINEEAADLILFQRAYQAAARIITIVDEMLQTALNM